MSYPSNSGAAQGQLKAYFERIERMHEEKKAIADDIAEIYAEAKANGFDTKVMKIVLQKRRMDADDRAEQEALVDLYMVALGMKPETGTVVATRAPARAIEHKQPQDADVHGVEAAEEQRALATDDAHDDHGTPAVVATNANSEPANTGGEDVNATAHTGEAAAKPTASPATSHIRLAGDEPPPFPGSFKNRDGAWRMEGCQKPDACAGMWNRRCGSCQKSWVASHPVTDGAPA